MNNFRKTLIAYCLLFLALTFPYWLQGEVIAPHRNTIEIAASETIHSSHIENRKFSDYSSGYIPELDTFINGNRSGFLTLWTDQNELGRPLIQASVLSLAYFPTWLISRITDSPNRIITLISLGTCFLTGLFILMLCRELRLSPLAGLLAAGSIATSPLLMYWLTFPMVIATYCWTAGAIYAVTLISKKSSVWGWFILALSIFSLLMAARKQAVIPHAYILGSYIIYVIYYRWKISGKRSTFIYLFSMASAVIVGGLLALPMLIDVAFLASESARITPDISFFTVVLPDFKSLMDLLSFVALGTFPEIFGSPITSSYPLPYNGLSTTPLVLFLLMIGAMVRFRSTWGWWLAIIFFSGLTFCHPFFIFAVQHLGFNLSRSLPLGSVLIPITLIVAYGADALLQRVQKRQYSLEVILAVVITMTFLLITVSFAFIQGVAIRWDYVIISFVVICLLAAQYNKSRPLLLVAVLSILMITTSFPLMPRQDPVQIITTSPLVEKVRAILPPGSRFAIAAPGLSVFPPNFNASLGLPSIHTYNSLSSRRYHTLIKALGGEVQTYGRWNGAISPDYNSAMFWMSNISMMLSPVKLAHENLAYLGEESNVHLYKVISRMGDSLQITFPQTNIDVDNVQLADPRFLPRHVPSKQLDRGDLLEYAVAPGEPSVLVLSQKFHRDWQAQVFVQSGWVPAKATVINGVFQGVLLSQDAQRVRLEFKPYARYAWIAHVFWLSLLALLGFKAWQRKRNFGSGGASTR